MDESLSSMQCKVRITYPLVCSPHGARLWDSLKTACKNVIFKHHTVKGCFAKPVFSFTCTFSLFFARLHSLHDLEVFNQILCCFPYCSDLKKPPTYHPLQNICIQTPFAVAESAELHVTTC